MLASRFQLSFIGADNLSAWAIIAIHIQINVYIHSIAINSSKSFSITFACIGVKWLTFISSYRNFLSERRRMETEKK